MPAGPGPRQIAGRMAALMAARRRLYEAGAVLVPGSDAGVSPAKPHDVLRFASEDLAVVGLAPGFDADILAIDGNPLADLAAIRRLRAVYARGRAVLQVLGSPVEVEVP